MSRLGLLAGGLIVFMVGGLVTAVVSAHEGDPDLIHGCVSQNGNLRVVGSDDECRQNETALDWNIQGVAGADGDDGAEGLAGPPGDGLSCENERAIKAVVTDFALTEECMTARLIVRKTATSVSPVPVVGGSIEYSITLDNTGDGDANDVAITDTPGGVEGNPPLAPNFEITDFDPDSACAGGSSFTAVSATCSIGTLPAGDSVHVRVLGSLTLDSPKSGTPPDETVYLMRNAAEATTSTDLEADSDLFDDGIAGCFIIPSSSTNECTVNLDPAPNVCIPGSFVACMQITSVTWVLDSTGPDRNFYTLTLNGVGSVAPEVDELIFTWAALIDNYQGNPITCDLAGGPVATTETGPVSCQFGAGRDQPVSSGQFSLIISTDIQFSRGVPLNQPDGTVVLGMEALDSSNSTIGGCGEGFSGTGYRGDCVH